MHAASDGSHDARARDGAPSAEMVPSLDGVRGIAILLVVLHNASPFDGAVSGGARLASILLNPGWIGVQLFFVLSGYLISGILLDSRSSPSYFRAFMGRRVVRIFPLYYATLIAFFVILPMFGAGPAAIVAQSHNQIFVWTYTLNWADPLGYGVVAFPHFWSLAVEEQFYLLWPLVVRVCTPQRLLRVTLVLAVIAFAIRVALHAVGANPDMAYQFTVCRMDALALGGSVAALLRMEGGRERFQRLRGKLFATSGALLLVGLVVTKAYARHSFVSQTVGYSLLAIAFAALIAGAVGDHLAGGGRAGRLLSNPVLRAFGKYSYGIYVFHPLIGSLIGVPLRDRFGWANPPVGIGLAYVGAIIASSFALAYVSYHGFEQHFLRLKRYFVPTPAPGTTLPSAS